MAIISGPYDEAIKRPQKSALDAPFVPTPLPPAMPPPIAPVGPAPAPPPTAPPEEPAVPAMPEAPTPMEFQYITGAQAAEMFGPEWYTGYESTFNPEGTPDFDWGAYGGIPVFQVSRPEGGDWQIESPITSAFNLLMLQPSQTGMQDWLTQEGYQWITPTESQPYQDMTSFIQQMQDPQYQSQLQQQGQDYVSSMLGVDYQERMPELDQQIAQSFAELQQIDLYGPMSPEAERQLQRDIETVRTETTDLIDALVGAGRGMQAWGALDQLNSQVQSLTTRARLEYSTNYLAKKQMEYEALTERYNWMAQQGMAAAGQFYEVMQNQQLMTMQGYMMQMNTIIQQDQMHMEIYQQHINQTYNAIMAQIGVEAHEMEMAAEYYAQYMTPYFDQLEAWLIGMQGDLLTEITAELAEPEVNWLGLIGAIFGFFTPSPGG